jgi:phosphatidate cytidylyltransferase
MWTRIVTGVGLAPLVVLLFLEGPLVLRAAVLIVAGAICLQELYAMALPDDASSRRLERWAGVALGAGLLTSLYLRPDSDVGDIFAGIVIPALLVVLKPDPIDRAGHRLFALWAGIFWIVFPLGFAIQLAVLPQPWILFVLGVVWCGDTGAYFVGRAIGRHKLHPRVSPKKTIEGAIGGLAGSVGGAFALVAVLDLPIDPLKTVFVALVGGAVAQLGDLTESLVKRACGVKDSGAILPGHGGMLDRIDGVLLALPFFYLALSR